MERAEAFAVLGLPQTACQSQITRTYRREALRLNGRVVSDHDAARFRLIVSAFNVLRGIESVKESTMCT